MIIEEEAIDEVIEVGKRVTRYDEKLDEIDRGNQGKVLREQFLSLKNKNLRILASNSEIKKRMTGS